MGREGEYRWALGGRVQGDSGIGLWIPLRPPGDSLLVRWEYIMTSLYAERPHEYRSLALSPLPA